VAHARRAGGRPLLCRGPRRDRDPPRRGGAVSAASGGDAPRTRSLSGGGLRRDCQRGNAAAPHRRRANHSLRRRDRRCGRRLRRTHGHAARLSFPPRRGHSRCAHLPAREGRTARRIWGAEQPARGICSRVRHSQRGGRTSARRRETVGRHHYRDDSGGAASTGHRVPAGRVHGADGDGNFQRRSAC
jgi:hypothetical protein